MAKALLITGYQQGSIWRHWVYEYENIYRLSYNYTNRKFTQLDKHANPMERNIYKMGYASDLMNILSQRHYYIASVCMNNTADNLSRGKLSYQGSDYCTRSGATGHWVALTGFSAQWDYTHLDSTRNWVRVMNPYHNQQEYYLWSEFRRSSNAGLGLELWQISGPSPRINPLP